MIIQTCGIDIMILSYFAPLVMLISLRPDFQLDAFSSQFSGHSDGIVVHVGCTESYSGRVFRGAHIYVDELY